MYLAHHSTCMCGSCCTEAYPLFDTACIKVTSWQKTGITWNPLNVALSLPACLSNWTREGVPYGGGECVDLWCPPEMYGAGEGARDSG